MTIKEWLRSYISEEEAVELWNRFVDDNPNMDGWDYVKPVDDIDELMGDMSMYEALQNICFDRFNTSDTWTWVAWGEGFVTGNRPIGRAEAADDLDLDAFRAWIPNHLNIVRDMGINTSTLERSLANDRAD